MLKKMSFAVICLVNMSACMADHTSKTTLSIYPEKPSFTIQLPSNPTTGYRWQLAAFDKRLISLERYQYLPSTKQLVGSPGTEVWVFKGLSYCMHHQAKTNLTFIYKRAWEKQAAKKINYEIHCELKKVK